MLGGTPVNHLLQIDASARRVRSLTRQLTNAFVAQWLYGQPDAVVTQRDVGAEPPPAVSEAWIAAAFAGAERNDEQRELLALSDRLIDEVEAADLILIGAPMYNYGMPAALKAWFDQIIRIDRTFILSKGRGRVQRHRCREIKCRFSQVIRTVRRLIRRR